MLSHLFSTRTAVMVTVAMIAAFAAFAGTAGSATTYDPNGCPTGTVYANNLSGDYGPTEAPMLADAAGNNNNAACYDSATATWVDDSGNDVSRSGRIVLQQLHAGLRRVQGGSEPRRLVLRPDVRTRESTNRQQPLTMATSNWSNNLRLVAPHDQGQALKEIVCQETHLRAQESSGNGSTTPRHRTGWRSSLQQTRC